jgi:hypothetical protein
LLYIPRHLINKNVLVFYLVDQGRSRRTNEERYLVCKEKRRFSEKEGFGDLAGIASMASRQVGLSMRIGRWSVKRDSRSMQGVCIRIKTGPDFAGCCPDRITVW